MWGLADRQIDEFSAKGKCEFITRVRQSLHPLVVADLLGGARIGLRHIPIADDRASRPAAGRAGPQAAGVPLRPVHGVHRGSAPQPPGRCHDRHGHRHLPRRLDAPGPRRGPDRGQPVRGRAGDDGTAPHRVAADCWGSAPSSNSLLREERHRIPNFIEETLRLESPIQGSFRLSRRADDGRWRRAPSRARRYGWPPVGPTTTPGNSELPTSSDLDRANARQHVAFGHGIHTCAGAPLARAEARVTLERFLDRTSDIRISESEHGPAGAAPLRLHPDLLPPGLDQPPSGVLGCVLRRGAP